MFLRPLALATRTPGLNSLTAPNWPSPMYSAARRASIELENGPQLMPRWPSRQRCVGVPVAHVEHVRDGLDDVLRQRFSARVTVGFQQRHDRINLGLAWRQLHVAGSSRAGSGAFDVTVVLLRDGERGACAWPRTVAAQKAGRRPIAGTEGISCFRSGRAHRDRGAVGEPIGQLGRHRPASGAAGSGYG